MEQDKVRKHPKAQSHQQRGSKISETTYTSFRTSLFGLFPVIVSQSPRYSPFSDKTDIVGFGLVDFAERVLETVLFMM